MVFDPRGAQPAPNSVGSVELKPSAKRSDPTGSSVDHAVTGTTSTRVERYEFLIDASKKLDEFKAKMTLKTDDILQAATAELWLDNDADWDANDLYIGAGTPDATATSVSLTDEIVNLAIGSTKANALTTGAHAVNVALKSANAANTATSTLREYEIERGDSN